MSDRDTADILPGATWFERNGEGGARVISTCMRHVVFEDLGDGAVRELHHFRFRERFEEPYDARQVRSQLSMSLANLGSFHVYWSASACNGRGRMYARSNTAPPEALRSAARGRPALPDDAVYLGTYSDGVIIPPAWHQARRLRPLEAFFDDLHELLNRLRRRPAAAI